MGNNLQFIGDHQPISTMFNGQMISGYDTNTYSGQEISVSDTYNDNLDLTVFGKTEQVKLSGKNLFDKSTVDYSTCISGRYNTYSVDPLYCISDFMSVSTSKIYVKSGVTGSSRIVFCDSSKNILIAQTKNDGDPIIPPDGSSYIQFNIKVTNLGNLIQLEESSTATSYEPYCGGIPAPNPDYPQEIQLSSGTITASPENGSTRPPTSIVLPTLRAIPDGNGGWVCRDELRSVGGGWYDVMRNASMFELTSSMNWKQGSDIYFVNLFNTRKHYKVMCNYIPHSGWGGNIYYSDYLYVSRAYMSNFGISNLDEFRLWLDSKKASGNPVVVIANPATPAIERIYLGDLNTYPHYTKISVQGGYPPDVTAQIKTIRR